MTRDDYCILIIWSDHLNIRNMKIIGGARTARIKNIRRFHLWLWRQCRKFTGVGCKIHGTAAILMKPMKMRGCRMQSICIILQQKRGHFKEIEIPPCKVRSDIGWNIWLLDLVVKRYYFRKSADVIQLLLEATTSMQRGAKHGVRNITFQSLQWITGCTSWKHWTDNRIQIWFLQKCQRKRKFQRMGLWTSARLQSAFLSQTLFGLKWCLNARRNFFVFWSRGWKIMLDLAGGTTVYLACGATDLRKSYHGLAAIIKFEF